MKKLTIITHTNVNNGKYFFSTDHCQPTDHLNIDELDHEGNNGWVPVTSRLPYYVAPRPGLEDGIVKTIDDYIFIHHNDDEEIPNPDPSKSPFGVLTYQQYKQVK